MNLPASDEKVQNTIKACIEKITAAGKIAGTYVGSPEDTKKMIDWGARYLVTSINSYMITGGKKYLEEVKKHL